MLGAEHPSIINSMNNLASAYRDQVRCNEAEKLEVQVTETSSAQNVQAKGQPTLQATVIGWREEKLDSSTSKSQK